MTLPIRNPQPAHRETLFSYVSRVAATWRTTATELASDAGTPFKRLVELQEDEAVAAFALWAGLDPASLAEMLSWTGTRAGEMRLQFRGEIHISRALRNPVVRGCPVCLREDAGKDPENPAAAFVMRGDWQLRDVVTCVQHGHPLIALWREDQVRRRYDIVARLGALRDDILSGTLDRSRSTPSDYDVWIDRRLRDGADQTALAKNPLSAAAPFCKLLGQALLRQHDLPDDAPTACFYDAGFAVARQGEAAIRAALDGLAATATRYLDLPPTVFGPLFSRPAWDASVVATLRPFMSILRECVLDHWPIDPGTMLLGEEVAQRRLHSLLSASREIGVSIPVIRQFLARTGAIDPNIDLPPSRVVFDAQAQSGLLADLPHFVGPKAMCAAIGATSYELTALQAAGVLAPLSADPDMRKSWLISDGAALVEELGAGAEPVGKGDPAWETLLRGCRRTGRGMREIVDAIRSGRVRSGCREGATGFHAIVVRKRDFDTLSAARAEDAAEDAEDISRMTSAAVFGRTLGLHNTSDFGGFVAAGHTPARQIRNPKTLRMQVFLSDEDVAAFHRRFVTIASL